MGVVSDIAKVVDNSLVDYVQNIFTTVSEPLRGVLAATALVALLFIAVNHLVQFRSVNYSMYLHWGLRYVLVYSFATIWANFHSIYTILIVVPSDYVALMMKSIALSVNSPDATILDPAQITDTYSAIDEFGHAIFAIAQRFFDDTSIFDLARSIRNIFLGVLILIIGALFIAAAAVIVMVGKIGFALAISLAPLAIVMLMLPQTKGHFESWSRFTVGFAVIPLLTAGLMAVVLYAGAQALVASWGSDDIVKYLSFLLIMIAALVIMFQIPVMASTLASASVAAVGAGAAFAAASMAKGMVGGAIGKAMSAGRRLNDGIQVARNARAAGAGAGGMASSAIAAMRQSAHIRSQRRDDRLSRRIVGGQGGGNAVDDRPRSGTARSAAPSSRSGGGGTLSPEQQNLYR